MATTKAKATWVPVWTVRYDGSRLDRFEARDRGGDAIPVRKRGEPGFHRWSRLNYERKFAATRAEAIQKFRAAQQRELDAAMEEIEYAQARLARVEALAAAEPQEQVH